MKIKMTRGALFQIAQDVKHIVPAKPAHSERFRRFASVMEDLNECIAPAHREEYEAAKEQLPVDARSEKALNALAKTFADKEVSLELEAKDLQVFVAACMAVWSHPGTQDGRGMPYGALKSLVQDLQALGAWDAWALDQKLVVEDPDLDATLPLGNLDDSDDLDEALPTSALASEG